MWYCVADEIRRVMMETVVPTTIGAVKRVTSKADSKSSQVLNYVMLHKLWKVPNLFIKLSKLYSVKNIKDEILSVFVPSKFCATPCLNFCLNTSCSIAS